MGSHKSDVVAEQLLLYTNSTTVGYSALAIDQMNKDMREEIGKKANKTDVVAEMLKKANKTDVDKEMAEKANKTDVDTEIGKKASMTYVVAEMFKKANLSDVLVKSETYTQKQVNDKLKYKANRSDVFVKDEVTDMMGSSSYPIYIGFVGLWAGSADQ